MLHTSDEVSQHIIKFLRSKLPGAPEIDPDAHFTRHLNLDSLLIFAVVEDLEETYKIVVPLDLLHKQRIQTVAELAKEVVRLIGEK